MVFRFFVFRKKGSRCFLYDEIKKAKSNGGQWFKTAKGYAMFEIIARSKFIFSEVCIDFTAYVAIKRLRQQQNLLFCS